MMTSPVLMQMEMRERAKRAPRDEELGRWRREVKGSSNKQGWARQAALALGSLLGLVLELSRAVTGAGRASQRSAGEPSPTHY